MADTHTTWRKRVAAWRASGETATVFSARHGFAVSALWRWSSRFKREADPVAGPPLVRLAQLVRPPASEASSARRGGIVVDLVDARARVTVEPGADRETFAMVVEVFRMGVAR